MENKKVVDESSLRISAFPIVCIIASFALGFLDMSFLGETFRNIVPSMEPELAYLTALLLATAANFSAYLWGYEKGKTKCKKVMCKSALGYFIFWILIGTTYFALRMKEFINSSYDIDVLIPMVILAISYISTGPLIATSAATLHNADAVKYRRLRKNFCKLRKQLAKDSADIQEELDILSDYSENYTSLENQYSKIKKGITNTERGTTSDIAGKILKEHPDVTPKYAHDIIESVLEKRKHND